MRNGRDRRSNNPSGPTRDLSACYCLGPISGSHQGQRPQRPHRDGGKPSGENRPYTWLHPNASQNVRFLLHRGRRPYMEASLQAKTGRIHGCTRTLRKTSDSSCTAGAVHTWAYARLERVLLFGTDQRITSGPAATAAASRWRQAFRRKQAVYMAAPERFAKRQIPLAPRAPSIHGPKRHFAAAQQSVALGGIADID